MFDRASIRTRFASFPTRCSMKFDLATLLSLSRPQGPGVDSQSSRTRSVPFHGCNSCSLPMRCSMKFDLATLLSLSRPQGPGVDSQSSRTRSVPFHGCNSCSLPQLILSSVGPPCRLPVFLLTRYSDDGPAVGLVPLGSEGSGLKPQDPGLSSEGDRPRNRSFQAAGRVQSRARPQGAAERTLDGSRPVA